MADETQCYYVLSALDQGTATCLLDLISLLPSENRYSVLKERLLDTFDLSIRERTHLGFCMPDPWGLQPPPPPPPLMDDILATLGYHPLCLLFEQLFLERLPRDIRVQLVDTKIEYHNQLAKKAVILWAAVRDMGTSTLPSSGVHLKNRERSLEGPTRHQTSYVIIAVY